MTDKSAREIELMAVAMYERADKAQLVSHNRPWRQAHPDTQSKWREYARAAVAALDAAGLAVVPVEPTDEMIEAFSRVRPAHYWPLRKWAEDTRVAIQAAIAASKEQK